jgi:hypothetical protein
MPETAERLTVGRRLLDEVIAGIERASKNNISSQMTAIIQTTDAAGEDARGTRSRRLGGSPRDSSGCRNGMS